jgi:N-hydroxyarylamine O-acetyltransferase
MELGAYLARVKFSGRPRPDLDTLIRVHRGHVENIPYENLDVQLGRTVTRDPAAIFDKLVTRGRGGWCYEMNGLLGWALDEIGFKVMRMAGGVGREQSGDEALGNHLVLRVELDQPFVADVGFGNGLIDPTPLKAGPIRQRGLSFSLEEFEPDWWRFHNDPRLGGPTFDFELKPADPARLDERCAWLQTSPDSGFVLNAVAQRHLPDGRLAMMRGKVFKMLADELTTREIASADDYVATLADAFNLQLPDAARLWPKIETRHRELFGAS